MPEYHGVLASLPAPSQFSRGAAASPLPAFPGTQPLFSPSSPPPTPALSLRVHHFPEPVRNPSLGLTSQAWLELCVVFRASCAEPRGGCDLHHQGPIPSCPHRSLSWSPRRALSSVSLNFSLKQPQDQLTQASASHPSFCSPRLNGWMGTFSGALALNFSWVFHHRLASPPIPGWRFRKHNDPKEGKIIAVTSWTSVSHPFCH